MGDYSELKRLAEALLASDDHADFPGWMAANDAFDNATGPAAVLALIAENERLFKLLERTVDQHVPLTELECVPGWSRAVELVEVVAERDQLKAENEALREEVALDDKIIANRDLLLSMFDCPEHGQCIPYAMEQVEVLRKDAGRYQWLRNDMNDVAITFGVHSWEDLSGEFMDSAIDAAMFQGEQP